MARNDNVREWILNYTSTAQKLKAALDADTGVELNADEVDAMCQWITSVVRRSGVGLALTREEMLEMIDRVVL
jgi:hypothetical protein